MFDDLEYLLEEIEGLLNALTDPDRKISGKSEEESISRYERFRTFKHSIIKLLNRLDDTLNEKDNE
jgi:hypothetical protein